MQQQPVHCTNQNHRRSDAKVRCCPSCGEVVNEKIEKAKCLEETHAKERKAMSKFCVHCGQQIIQ